MNVCNKTSRWLFSLFLLFYIISFTDQAEARQGFSSSSSVKNDSVVFEATIPENPCRDILWKKLKKKIKTKKLKISDGILKKFPERLQPFLESIEVSPKKLFIQQCNSYKQSMIDTITEPVKQARKKLDKARADIQAAPQKAISYSLIQLRLGFLTWVAEKAREQILPALSADEQKRFNSDTAYAQQMAQEWLPAPEKEIEAYVKVYLQENHSLLLRIYESYIDLTGGQSKEIISGLGDIMSSAQDKLRRFGILQKELSDPVKKKTPYAKILKDNGFSGEWLKTFKGYEGDLRHLNKKYNVVAAANIIKKSFQTDEPAEKIDALFELMDNLAGTAANSKIPIVSLFGDIIQAYAQVGKQMLAAVNGLGETLRKRGGYCIGVGVPEGRSGIDRYEEAKQAASQLSGVLLCPLAYDTYPFRHVYEAVDKMQGRLFFWDGKKFIVGNRHAGGKAAVQESLKLISRARKIGYQIVEEKKKGVALLGHVYNTPFTGGIPKLMSEARDVMDGITKQIHKYEPAISRASQNCPEQDLLDYFQKETGLNISAFKKAFYDELVTTYAASYVAKHSGFGKKNTARGKAYKRYKKIWDKIESLNIYNVYGEVLNENNSDVSCLKCRNAELDIRVSNGHQFPGCEVTKADKRSHYEIDVITKKSTFTIDLIAKVQGISGERRRLSEEDFKRWAMVDADLYVKLEKPDKPDKAETPEPETPDPVPIEQGESEPESGVEEETTEEEDPLPPAPGDDDVVILPDVIGMTPGDAAAALAAVGLVALPPEIGRAAVNPGDVGKVELALPTVDGELHRGDEIILQIYDEAVASSTVPNVVGMPLDKAAKVIGLAGLNPVFVLGDETSDISKDGTIASQAPASGIQIETGRDVSLMVYEFAIKTQTVPDVYGLKLAAAKSRLSSNNLVMTPFLEEAAPVKLDEGLVYMQNPEAGLEVESGTVISVWVFGEYLDPDNDKDGKDDKDEKDDNDGKGRTEDKPRVVTSSSEPVSGEWQGQGEMTISVGNKKSISKFEITYDVQQGRVKGRLVAGKKNNQTIEVNGKAGDESVLLKGTQTMNDATISMVLKGKIKEDDSEYMIGAGSITMPEMGCVARELGKAIGNAVGGGKDEPDVHCPNHAYPITWFARKQGAAKKYKKIVTISPCDKLNADAERHNQRVSTISRRYQQSAYNMKELQNNACELMSEMDYGKKLYIRMRDAGCVVPLGIEAGYNQVPAAMTKNCGK